MAEKPIIICRVCLRSDRKISEKCLSLFEKYKNGLISDTINSIADVGIQEGDGLPSKICPECLLELDTAVSFKSKCENSNNLLRTTTLNDDDIFGADHSSGFDIDDIKKEVPEDHPRFFVDVDVCKEEMFVESKYDLDVIAERDKVSINKQKRKREKVKKINVTQCKDLAVECHDCGEHFKSKCKLRVHWKKTHMLEKLVCEKCKRAFKTVYAYNKHLKDKNAPCLYMATVKIEGTGKDRVFHCNECKYVSHRLKDMKRHLNTHTGLKPYQCNICNRSYTQRSSLNSHLEVAHKMFKTEVTCPYCGKYLRGRTRVYSHLRMHRQKTLQCDLCKKMIRSKRNLIIHLKRHAGVKMYTCELCGSSYCTIWELSNHKRTIHEKGQHIYKCDICAYKTFRNETLYRHKKRHTQTNICCLVCGCFVTSAEALVQHQKRHFKKFSCPYCDLKYARKDSLQKHIRAKHEFIFSSSASKPVVVKTETSAASLRDDVIDVDLNLRIK